MSPARWHTPLILELGRQRQGISEFEASLILPSEFHTIQDYMLRSCLKKIFFLWK